MNNPQLCRCGGVESIWHSFHYCLQNALKNTQTYTHSRAPARSAYITSEQSFCTYFYYGFTKRYSLLQLRCEEKKVNLISLWKEVYANKNIEFYCLLFTIRYVSEWNVNPEKSREVGYTIFYPVVWNMKKFAMNRPILAFFLFEPQSVSRQISMRGSRIFSHFNFSINTIKICLKEIERQTVEKFYMIDWCFIDFHCNKWTQD